MAGCYVYVIGLGRNPVKLGIAVDPRERLSTLQCGCPDELTLHGFVQVPQKASLALEASAHQALKEHHRRGEWFNVDAQHALDVLALLREEAVQVASDAALRSRSGDAEVEFEWEIGWRERAAIGTYRMWLADMDPKKRALAGHVNALVLQREGMGALQVFRMVVAEKKSLAVELAREPIALRRGRRALAKAVVVLADFIQGQADARLARQLDISRKSAA